METTGRKRMRAAASLLWSNKNNLRVEAIISSCISEALIMGNCIFFLN